MLSLIRVKNYAVIDEVELEFDAGLSVVTGETGAGKSIIVDALGLALGDRADASSVRHGAERAEISVLFECPQGHAAIAWLEELGLEDGTSCSLRRIVSNEGRSRAFINNHPVTLQDLRQLGSMLVDIHGQHAHQSLLHGGSQRALLDEHGKLHDLVERVSQAHLKWRDLEEQLAARQGGNAERDAQLELLRFQVTELEAHAPTEDEPAQLQTERGRLANIDKLASGLDAALYALSDAETGAAHSLVARAQQELSKLVEHDDSLAEQLKSLATAEIELREVTHALTHYRDRLESDPARLEAVESRLAKIRALSRRHAVAEEELPKLLDTLSARIEELEGSGQSLEKLTEQSNAAADAYFAAAKKLSAARKKCAIALGEAVSAQLPELGLVHGQFHILLEPKPRERADATGLDRIEFQVRLNPGQPFGPLAKMASGGELSRVGLALEVVGAGTSSVPTFVFDEVDAGIGGGVAEIVGRKLAKIAGAKQVMCVTHLPQVASQGRQHYRVAKLTDGKTSRTSVRRLSPEERVEELSRMLGGVEITDLTRAHAEEMIGRAADAPR